MNLNHDDRITLIVQIANSHPDYINRTIEIVDELERLSTPELIMLFKESITAWDNKKGALI